MNVSNYKGSEITASLVRKQIEARFGALAGEEYDPKFNCFTLPEWRKRGYRVKKGEKSIKSYTYIELKDEEGTIKDSIRRTVHLFFQAQVEQIIS